MFITFVIELLILDIEKFFGFIDIQIKQTNNYILQSNIINISFQLSKTIFIKLSVKHAQITNMIVNIQSKKRTISHITESENIDPLYNNINNKRKEFQIWRIYQ